MKKPHLRFCNNRQCTLFETPMEFVKGKTCGSCGLKTEYYGKIEDEVREVGTHDDRPPLSYRPPLQLMTGEPEAKPGEGDPITLESNCDIKGSCPILKDGPTVHMPYTLYVQCLWLARKFKVEWIAYLTGELKDSAYYLNADGIYFPNQIASGVTVVPEDLQAERDQTIATIHSHVDMDAFFSTTDYKHFNKDVELVINSRGSLDCITRTQLKCGEFQRIRSRVNITEAAALTSITSALQSKLIIEEGWTSDGRLKNTRTVDYRSLPSRYQRQGPVVVSRREEEEWTENDYFDTGKIRCAHDVPLAQPCPKCGRGGRQISAKTAQTDDHIDSKEPPTPKLVEAAAKVLLRAQRHYPHFDLRKCMDAVQDKT